MNYAAIDAGEQEMRHELEALRELNEEIDQLASDANKCETLCPEVRRILDAAWYFTEKAIRETTGSCSAHSDGFCQCCHQFNKISARSERMGSI